MGWTSWPIKGKALEAGCDMALGLQFDPASAMAPIDGLPSNLK